MEFQNRGGQHPAQSSPSTPPAKSGRKNRGKGLRILSGVMLIAIAALIAMIPLFIVTSNNSEESLVKDDKFQAVFLNGGQVYFGKVQEINDKYMTMDNIYYLRVNEQVQPNPSEDAGAGQDISLAKLGCELHGPEDLMVITRDQVSFWENLKSDGQVTQAINEFIKQNPDGQTCAQPTADQ